MKLKTVYVCTECGAQSQKWLGKCPHCGKWNTLTEEVIDTAPEEAKAPKRTSMAGISGENKAMRFGEMKLPTYIRTDTGLDELDRVLGGGLVTGSVVLLSGEPGIGKSTLLMQISDVLGQNRRVLYVSGEESGGQLSLRAKRLGVTGDQLYILTETNLESILEEAKTVKPDVMILDSIQTIYSDKINSAPGSVTQVRECALTFMAKAKSEGISMLLVGHVNKEGGIAGPKVLEHMVDAVLYFEGERQQAYRIIRAVKNRYGSVSEPLRNAAVGPPQGGVGQLRSLHHGGHPSPHRRGPGAGDPHGLPCPPPHGQRCGIQPYVPHSGGTGKAVGIEILPE